VRPNGRGSPSWVRGRPERTGVADGDIGGRHDGDVSVVPSQGVTYIKSNSQRGVRSAGSGGARGRVPQEASIALYRGRAQPGPAEPVAWVLPQREIAASRVEREAHLAVGPLRGPVLRGHPPQTSKNSLPDRVPWRYSDLTPVSLSPPVRRPWISFPACRPGRPAVATSTGPAGTRRGLFRRVGGGEASTISKKDEVVGRWPIQARAGRRARPGISRRTSKTRRPVRSRRSAENVAREGRRGFLVSGADQPIGGSLPSVCYLAKAG